MSSSSETAASYRPRVFSIPSGVDFLACLADALLSGTLIDGFPARMDDLAEATIYLPTRRAARALTMLLAERMAGKTILMPRVVPLGEVDPLGLDMPDAKGLEDASAALAPPIGTVERRLILTRLVQQWSRSVDHTLVRLEADHPFIVPSSPADAIALAGDLEALMDQFTTEDAPWAEMSQVVEAEYSAYFKLTLEFVRIASESWPLILSERGASDPAQRRKLLVEAETERLRSSRPNKPIIAAGSTGSIPSTARLLTAIAGLPRGAVVLPGLDRHLDDTSWDMIGSLGDDETDPMHGHPQTTLQRLLKTFLRLSRSDVRVIGEVSPAIETRNRYLSEILRPAESSDLWAALPGDERLELALQGSQTLTVIEASDEREEALACAVALRETLAKPGRNAALVTPDRGLARRVTAELLRWNIEVEDSAGTPLSQSLAGRLARLVAEVAAQRAAPHILLSLLTHPFVTFGKDRATVEAATAALEIGVLRGPTPAPGWQGLKKALSLAQEQNAAYKPTPWKRLDDSAWQAAADLLNALEHAFVGFSPDDFPKETDLTSISRVHLQVVDRLCPDDITLDESQEALDALFTELAQAGQDIGVQGTFADYPAFFTALASERSIAPSGRLSHSRVKILGLLEARLLSADRIVLGGLDEGLWPPRVTTDAFLNRPMRAHLGLVPPERRIGQTAHDFVQLAATDDVIITRASKRDGSPTVPSRFLQRMKAFGGNQAWQKMVERGEYYRHLVQILETPQPVPPLHRPAPKPHPSYFPRSLSVTEIETLQRDPYSIYAKHILKLDALDPLAQAPDAADRGTIIHDVFAAFAMRWQEYLPDEAEEALLALGRTAFGDILEAFPQIYAEWWPRFERLARAFIPWEQDRRATLSHLSVEHPGRLPISLEDGSVFTLRGRADRIEQHQDGTAVIIDFKTGHPPGIKEIFAGFSPQMTLEAAMLLEGAFNNIPAPDTAPDLIYVHASGGNPALKPRIIKPENGESRSVADIIAEHRRRLEVKLNDYVAGRASFTARLFPKFERRYSDYDHLARVKEWSLTSGGDGGDGEESE